MEVDEMVGIFNRAIADARQEASVAQERGDDGLRVRRLLDAIELRYVRDKLLTTGSFVVPYITETGGSICL